jgi:hypothetical protein
MHSERKSGPVLPEDARPAGVGGVIAAYALAVLLFIVTLGAD